MTNAHRVMSTIDVQSKNFISSFKDLVRTIIRALQWLTNSISPYKDV